MRFNDLRDRRFRPPSPLSTPTCRLCWRAIDLERGVMEPTEGHVYLRCPHCGGSFPIRSSDYQAFIDRHPLRLL
jgi:uncharacterized C2H2 Zn-finger protein